MASLIDTAGAFFGFDPDPVKTAYFNVQVPFRSTPPGPDGQPLEYDKSLLERAGGIVMAIPETVVGTTIYLGVKVIKLGADKSPSLLDPNIFMPTLTLLAIGAITWAFYPLKTTVHTYNIMQTVKAVPYTLLVLYTLGFGLRTWGRLNGPALDTFDRQR